MKKVVIIGAGGHGKVVADIINKNGDEVVGFLDDGIEPGTKIVGFEVLGNIDNYREYKNCEFVIAIGNPNVREEVANTLSVKWYTAIHPNAVVSSLGVEIGEGTVIMANAVVNSSTQIGRHCIINTAAVVEHDSVLEDYVHISPNATLSGIVTVGKSTHIGSGTCTKQMIRIAPNCIIGAGSVVINNIVESGIYAGVPVKKIR